MPFPEIANSDNEVFVFANHRFASKGRESIISHPRPFGLIAFSKCVFMDFGDFVAACARACACACA